MGLGLVQGLCSGEVSVVHNMHKLVQVIKIQIINSDLEEDLDEASLKGLGSEEVNVVHKMQKY